MITGLLHGGKTEYNATERAIRDDKERLRYNEILCAVLLESAKMRKL